MGKNIVNFMVMILFVVMMLEFLDMIEEVVVIC